MAKDNTSMVAASIRNRTESLPTSRSRCCIYKVPSYLRRRKEECYRPLLVSIGPVYYGHPHLKAMEEYKLRCLQLVLEHQSNPHGLEHYIELINQREGLIRGCYEIEVSMRLSSSSNFTEMVLLDAAFIIYFFVFPIHEDLIPVYYNVRRDLFLADNQLPFFVVEDLFQEAFQASFPDASFCDMFRELIDEGWIPLPGGFAAEFELNRIRIAEAANIIDHLVNIMRTICLASIHRNYSRHHDLNIKAVSIPTASNLKAAGVKFVASKTRNLLDVTFAKGVLEMPTLIVSDYSESFFRSVIFYEQRRHYADTYLIEYIYFLDRLIDTQEDVRILVQSEILENWLASEQAVVDLFNGIADELTIEISRFYYAAIADDLKAHTDNRWNEWKAVLKREYFSHPWAVISVVYAVILLILTILQTISSFTTSK